jgi:epoxyqueuosine reductase QueG
MPVASAFRRKLKGPRLLTSVSIKRRAQELGFDLCGIARADNYPELSFLAEWLDRGYAATMGWMHRSAERRADVRHVVPGARSVIVTATLYNTDRHTRQISRLRLHASRDTRGATITTTR